MLKYVENHISIKSLKEDCRKMGINFITAGIVGVFINHYAGSNFSSMLLASVSITIFGILTLYFGLRKRKI